jgi:hypothetical protein
MDRQFFKPPPTATSFDPASLGLPPVSQPEPQARQHLPLHEMGVGGKTDSRGRLLLPHEVLDQQPPPMSQPPYIGGVQSAPKVAISTPGIPRPPSHQPYIDKPKPRTNIPIPFMAKLQPEPIQSAPTSAMGGMMIPLLIGGGILLIILLR